MKLIIGMFKGLILLLILSGDVYLISSLFPGILFFGLILKFFSWMGKKQILHPGSSHLNEMRKHQQQMSDEMNRRNSEYFTQESLKSVTPWEHGGYDLTQGNSFNNPNPFN